MTRDVIVVLAAAMGVAVVVATAMLTLPVPGRGAETARPDDPADGNLVFVDVASEVGLDFHHGVARWGPDAAGVSLGSGVCWLDFDDDGWLDLYAVNDWSESEWDRWQEEGGVPTSRLFRNERGSFVDVTEETGTGLDVHGRGCVAADFDGDGHVDLYVTSTRDNALLWNTGDGSFREGASEAGLATDDWSAGAAAGDVNGDGLMDLFVAGYAESGEASPGGRGARDGLYLNLGSRRFVDAAAELGIDTGPEPGRGVGGTLVDIDLDQDLDLVVVNDAGPNRLYLNESSGQALRFSLVDASDRLGVGDVEGGHGLSVADHNGDTWPDLAFSGPTGVALLESGEAAFVDRTAAIGRAGGSPGTGIGWADFDLDTDQDLLVIGGYGADVHPSLFVNAVKGGTVRYLDRSEETGLEELGPLAGGGSAVADYDNDGDLDAAINPVGGDLVLLSNRGAGGHWLGLDLGDDPPGTRVEALLLDGTTLVRTVTAGSGHLSSVDPRVLLGLGTVSRVQTLTIERPNGSKTVYDGVSSVDRYLDPDS